MPGFLAPLTAGLTSLNTALAPVGGVSNVVGGLFGGLQSALGMKANSEAEYEQRRINNITYQRNADLADRDFRRARLWRNSNVQTVVKDARKAGINPHFAIAGGATPGGAGLGGGHSAPRLASPQLKSVGFDALSDVLTGDAARRRKALELEIDLAEIEKDQKTAEAETNGSSKGGTKKRDSVDRSIIETSGLDESEADLSTNSEIEVQAPIKSNPHRRGSNYLVFPFNPSVDDAEGEYWEFGGAAAGVRNVVDNLLYNAVLRIYAHETGRDLMKIDAEIREKGPTHWDSIYKSVRERQREEMRKPLEGVNSTFEEIKPRMSAPSLGNLILGDNPINLGIDH